MPAYDYVCRNEHRMVRVFPYETRPSSVKCPECRELADYVISAPAIHTLETALRGTGIKTDCDGGYYDANICDKGTNKPTYITSVRQKERELEKRGLYQKATSDLPDSVRDSDKRRDTKPIHFT